MVQNMEKYFGFKVFMENSLDPVDIDVLTAIAKHLSIIHRIDTDKYLVYFHHLRIVPERFIHFNFTGAIEDRLNWLIIEFSVNKKQAETGAIKFFNSLIPDEKFPEMREQGIVPSYDVTKIVFNIPGKYFSSKNYYKSTIITFVDRNIRLTHQKITATVTAVPSQMFSQHIHTIRNRVQHTKIVIDFQKQVQLKIPFASFPLGDISMTNNYVNYGQAAAFGHNAQASQVQQSFRTAPDTAELLKLLTEVSQYKDASQKDLELLRMAVTSSEKNSMISFLSQSSKWLLDKAEKLSLPLAVEIIKQATGLTHS